MRITAMRAAFTGIRIQTIGITWTVTMMNTIRVKTDQVTRLDITETMKTTTTPEQVKKGLREQGKRRQ